MLRFPRDLDNHVGSIPAERMNSHAFHTIHLRRPAVDLVEQALMLRDGPDLVFPCPVKGGSALSDMTLIQILHTIGLTERTIVHGLRATFRTWASERTDSDRAVGGISPRASGRGRRRARIRA